MANSKFGAVDWADDFGGNSEKKPVNNKDTWLRLDAGNNVIRLVTRPHQYLVHKGVKAEGDKGFGQKVSCSAIHGSCPLCDLEDKAGARWLLGVIDRKTSSYKILDVSWQVFSQIKKLANETEVWGDPFGYDLNIIVDKNGGPTSYYSVQPRPHKPLSAEDQALRDNADLEDLQRRVTPLTPEQVQKRMEKVLNGGTLAKAPVQPGKEKNGKAPATKSAAPKGKAAPVVEMEAEDNLDDIFPPHADSE